MDIQYTSTAVKKPHYTFGDLKPGDAFTIIKNFGRHANAFYMKLRKDNFQCTYSNCVSLSDGSRLHMPDDQEVYKYTGTLEIRDNQLTNVKEDV